MSIKRQDIVSAMETRFAAIATPTYHNTLSGKVFAHFGKTPVDETLIDIRDTDERIEQYINGAFWDRRLTVEIAIVCSGSTSAVTMRQLLEDIWKSIGTDLTWSGYAIDTLPVSSNIEVDQEENRITGATATVEVLYRTTAWAES